MHCRFRRSLLSVSYYNRLTKTSYQVQRGIVYLTLAERNYPQKLAFLFLKDIADALQDELRNSYGTSGGIDYLSKIETIFSVFLFHVESTINFPLLFINLARFSQTRRFFGRNLLLVRPGWRFSEGVLPKSQ